MASEQSAEIHKETIAKLTSNENLKERIKDLQNLQTKHKNHYNAEMRLVYFDLLIKVCCVSSVVCRVLDTLGDKLVKNTPLPSRSTAQKDEETGFMVKLSLAWQWKGKVNKYATFHCHKTMKEQLKWLSIFM